MRPWLTMRSLRRAFSRVRENRGAAGADGVTIERFADSRDLRLTALRDAIEKESYFAWPLRKVEIEKRPGSTERRRLLIPTVTDRVAQTAAAIHLETILEPEFENCSYAYRRGRSVRMAVERVHALYQDGYRWLLDADIDAFFDSVNSGVVLGRLSVHVTDESLLRLVRLWLDYQIWDGARLERPGLGLPQGSPISPLLANLCLDDLDERLLDAHYQVVRYADDFVVLTRSRRDAERALDLTEDTLETLRLRLHEGKTKILRYQDGFKFLGIVFLRDLLLAPLKPRNRNRRVLLSAPAISRHFFPASERRPLRRYGLNGYRRGRR